MQQKKYTGLIAVGAILLILVIWVFTSYNSLIKNEEKVKLQWSEVQSTYQRRLDLIPSLVNVVKGVSDFEQTTLTKITEARSKALSGMSNDDITAENYQKQKQLQDTLAASANRMIMLIEKYPTLKGTAAYSGLQTQLEGSERRIKVARNDFNKAVADYNRKVRSFPANIVAGLFGFKKKDGFEAAAGTEKSVEIKF
ncbi:MAG: LemA family protein [Chitinophagaceae bacterium]|nr:LemA family protein [Chitinophagaceae bacterium]MBL0131744.1 LemA family protein [Chitinophagaceae bacterium]MBL0272091.1 LemA family protein [Chitinophagaceae bacterium]